MKNQVFLVGGGKCGTTFLYHCLRQHPRICFSQPKEPSFFMLDEEFERGKEYYLEEYFDHYDNEPWLGEARAINLYLPWVPERMADIFPNAKILMAVRNPVDRAYSNYLHNRRKASEGQSSFSKAIYEDFLRIERGKHLETAEEKEKFQRLFKQTEESLYRFYLDGGYYESMIKRYLDKFSLDNVYCAVFERFIKNPLEECNQIFQFLNLDSVPNLEVEQKNEGSVPRSYTLQKIKRWLQFSRLSKIIPGSIKNVLSRMNLKSKGKDSSLNPITRLWLYQHFQPHNKKLEGLFDLELPSSWYFRANNPVS